MSLTEEIIEFLEKTQRLLTFCNIVGIEKDALEGWLYDVIFPDNIECFFDFGIVVKDEKYIQWCEEASKEWSEYYIGVNERREQSQIDSLASLAFDNGAPDFLKNIATSQLRKIGDDPLRVDGRVASTLIKKLGIKASK